MGWVQVPDAARRPRRDRSTAITLLIATAGPLARSLAMPAAEPVVVALVVLAATTAAASTPRRWWWARAGLGAAVVAALVPTQGASLAVWSAFAVTMAAWVGRDRPPLPLVPTPSDAVATPVVVLSLVAAWLGLDADRAWQWAVPLGAAALTVIVDARWRGAPGRLAHRVGTAAGDAVAAVAFTLLGAILVVVPWGVHRVAGLDPLDNRRDHGWHRRRIRGATPDAPWSPDATAPERGRWADPRPAATLIVVIAVAVLAVQAWPYGIQLPSSQERVSAHDGDNWYPQYRRDIAWALDEGVASRPFMAYPVLDVETQTVNVRDGYRTGWTAPACDCHRLTVWLYGGDGAFGFDQRDEHTIASEISRRAASAGLVVDVANRGLPGQPQWRAALRMANDLMVDPPPDLVLFYGGAEELAAAAAIDERGVSEPRTPSDAAQDALYAEITRLPDRPSPPDPASDIEFVGEQANAPRADAEVERLAVARFARFRAFGRPAAAAAGVPLRYAWQPSRAGTPTDVPLPDDVIDLRTLLRDAGDTVFVDGWRHDEDGARAVAAALWTELAPDLRALADNAGAGE